MANTKPKSNKKAQTPYVNYQTLWKGVGGGLSNPGESRVCKVGKHRILVSRSQRLNYYGNPVHTVSVIHPDGTTGRAYRTSGSATTACEQALKSEGIQVRHRTAPRRK